jgi:hypothetical protein
VKGTGTGDWSAESVQSQPYKKDFVDKLTGWSEKLFDRSVKAFDYAQPKDAYADMPSIRTLVPVPLAFPSERFSIGFLSVLEDIKHRKDFKAVAYSPQTNSRTANGNSWGFATQAEADKKALENCEQRRGSTTPPCKLVNLAEIGIASVESSVSQAPLLSESSSSVETKLEKLKMLKSKGLISTDQHDKQVAEILQKM